MVFEFPPFRLHVGDRLLYRGTDVVALPPKAVDTLVALVERRGRVVAKDELMAVVWADAWVEENNLNQAISAVRKALGQTAAGPVFIETISKRGYRFAADVVVREVQSNAVESQVQGSGSDTLEQMGGAMPIDSAFYVIRDVDADFEQAITRRDSIVLLKGARQMGKTSLLARGLERARQAGVRVVLTDFQDLASTDLASSESLFLTLGKSLAEELELNRSPKDVWDVEDSANTNFGRFVRKEVLGAGVPVLWALDEVDRLFPYSFASEVFGLFRAWHNRRALDPRGPWRHLTLAMAYATEASLFITDINQSPFNVGTRLVLSDLTEAHVEDLNRRYGTPLSDVKDLRIFTSIVGGQPFLVQTGLHALASGLPLDRFVEVAPSLEGPFGEHLHRLLLLIGQDDQLRVAVWDVLEGRRPADAVFLRLRSAGVLLGESSFDARMRCLVYSLYFERHLARPSELVEEP